MNLQQQEHEIKKLSVRLDCYNNTTFRNFLTKKIFIPIYFVVKFHRFLLNVYWIFLVVIQHE